MAGSATAALFLALLETPLLTASFDSAGFDSLAASRELRRNLLSIELQESAWTDIDFHSGTASSETWYRWKAYQGFRPISEESFFRLTGYPEEADEARAYRMRASRQGLIGVFAGLAGFGILWAGLSATAELPDPGDPDAAFGRDPGGGDWTTIVLGTIIGAAGIALGIDALHKLGRNWAPYDAVWDAAAEYNHGLYARFRESP